MNPIEDLVRDSLRQRATDVEPTPMLWQEVDRRIARRRRTLVLSWSLAGAAAVFAAVAVVPGLLGADDRGALEIEPIGPSTGDGDAAEHEESDVDGPRSPDRADTDGTSAGPLVTVDEHALTLTGPDGAVSLVELPTEGESRFLSARVQPGSTVDDLTVVALTTAEGFFDLRHLHYRDGEVVTWEPFEPQYAPGIDRAGGEDLVVDGPVWSPGGDLLAWLELGNGSVTLRTVGWDAGPGTGDSATDNASWPLDGLPAVPLTLHAWNGEPGSPGSTQLIVSTVQDPRTWFEISVEIQGDGAPALSGDAVEVEAPATSP